MGYHNKKSKIPAINFIGTILANLDNENLDDKSFRDMIRNTISIVEKPKLDENMGNRDLMEKMKKYY